MYTFKITEIGQINEQEDKFVSMTVLGSLNMWEQERQSPSPSESIIYFNYTLNVNIGVRGIAGKYY